MNPEDKDRYERALAVIDRAQEFRKHFSTSATDPDSIEKSRQSAKDAIARAYANWELEGETDVAYEGGVFPRSRVRSLRSQITHHMNQAWLSSITPPPPTPGQIDRAAFAICMERIRSAPYHFHDETERHIADLWALVEPFLSAEGA